MTKAKERERDEARETLRAILPPGSTVFTVLRHCARSGMSRDIDCYAIEDGEPRWISRLVSKAAGLSFNEKREAVRMGGCGMDMGFALVHALSYALHGHGFECIGEKCPSNDHSNGDRDYTPHQHKSGGYSLRHRWM